MPSLSLRSKLLLLFLLAVLLPLSITGIWSSRVTGQMTRERVIQDEQTRLSKLTLEIERFLDTTLSDIRILSGSTAMQTLAQAIADRQSLRLEQLRSSVEEDFLNFVSARQIADSFVYQHIRFLNTNGFEFVRVNNVNGQVNVAARSTLNTRATEDYFRQTINLTPGEIYVSPIEIFDEFGRILRPYVPVLRYSMPIYGGETFVGVLVTDVRAEGFLQLVTAQQNSDGMTFMADQTGSYIAHPDGDKRFGAAVGTGITVQQESPELSFLLDRQQTGVTEAGDNVIVYESTAPEGASGFFWTVVSVLPLSSVLAIVQQQEIGILFTLGVVAVISVIVAVVFSRRISRPIIDVTEAARAIANGSFDRVVAVTSRDEIGTLQVSINTMAKQIKQSIDTLEERVRDRTAKLDDARRIAEAASNAKSEFLSNMSHELRTPLNMVIGYTTSMLYIPEMYKEVVLPDIYKKDIQTIQKNGEHLLGLINDILDLSKIEAGKLTLSPQPVDLLDIVRGVVATSVGLVKDKAIQVRPDHPVALPFIWGDPLRVRQVLLNLMSNAIKFTDTGYVTLKAELQGDQVRISVQDTGIGINEEDLKTIFDRYAQIQNKATIQGTGLGLDICQRLLQMHDSELEVTSAVGIGSTFTFTLPLATAEQIALASDPEPDTDVTRIPVEVEPMNWESSRIVLLIEKDAETRAKLNRSLEDAKYVVFEHHPGDDILELASTLTLDLIIMDDATLTDNSLSMYATLRSHEATQHIPIILMSEDNQEKITDSRTRTLQKPVPIASLIECVEELLTAKSIA